MRIKWLSTSGEASKLAVLGLLSIGPNHGYGLRAILEGWQVHRWLDVKYGSIYATLRRFEKTKLVEIVAVDFDQGPTRTTYELTPDGRQELIDLARRAWTDPPRWSNNIDLAVMFLALDWLASPILERSEIAALLDERIADLELLVDEFAETAERVTADPDPSGLRRLQQAHFDHGLTLLNAELAWSRSMREVVAQQPTQLTQRTKAGTRQRRPVIKRSG